MTIAYWCVFFAALLPYVFAILAKSGHPYDNQKPREYLEALQGWKKRAHWAHLNSFEAFPSFAAAVIIAQQLRVDQTIINQLAITFILARILYGLLYIRNRSTLRTMVWLIGFICMIALFVISLKTP